MSQKISPHNNLMPLVGGIAMLVAAALLVTYALRTIAGGAAETISTDYNMSVPATTKFVDLYVSAPTVVVGTKVTDGPTVNGALWTPPSAYAIQGIDPGTVVYTIAISCGKHGELHVSPDGSVGWDKDCNPNDAAKLFWALVGAQAASQRADLIRSMDCHDKH